MKLKHSEFLSSTWAEQGLISDNILRIKKALFVAVFWPQNRTVLDWDTDKLFQHGLFGFFESYTRGK